METLRRSYIQGVATVPASANAVVPSAKTPAGKASEEAGPPTAWVGMEMPYAVFWMAKATLKIALRYKNKRPGG